MHLSSTLNIALFLSAFALDALALGVQFTKPAGGATLSAGETVITWTDAGGDPDMSELVLYNLVLVVGGNSPSNSEVLDTIASNGTVANGNVTTNISPDVAQSIQNGFYLQMTSNTSAGNTVVNYSNRFTLVNMNGSTSPNILQAANAAAGSASNVPNAYNLIPPPTSSSTTTTTTTTSSSASTAPATSTVPPSTPDDSSEASTNSSPMPSGVIAGIVAVVVLALIGLISICVWSGLCWKRLRRKNVETRHNSVEISTFVDRKAELPASPASFGLSRNDELHEAPGSDKAVEIGDADMVYELEGGFIGWEAGSGRKSRAYDPTL